MKECFFTLTALATIVFTLGFSQNAVADENEPEPKKLYQAGESAFNDEQYEQALAFFTQAYNLSAEAELLFNIAVCHEKLGHSEKAIAFYQLYLDENPNSPDKDKIKSKLKMLQNPNKNQSPPDSQPKPIISNESDPSTIQPEQDPSSSQEQTTPEMQSTESQSEPAETDPLAPKEIETVEELDNLNEDTDRKPFGPGILIGTGGLVLAAATLTAILTNNKYKQLERSCQTTCTDDQIKPVKAGAAAADVQFIIGGATVTAGIIWWIIKAKQESSGNDIPISLTPTASMHQRSGGIALWGRF